MIDVSGKDVTVRTARATGRVTLSAEVAARLRVGDLPKGDVLSVARVAGITGAKRTPDLIPLCHPIGLTGVDVTLDVAEPAGSGGAVTITADVRTTDRTGVEMEALTAVVTAGLTVVDMVKGLDPAAVITDVRVEEKTGGKTGTWQRAREGAEA